MAKIISLSVWGSKPQYSVGAIKNIELAEKIFPDWKCPCEQIRDADIKCISTK